MSRVLRYIGQRLLLTIPMLLILLTVLFMLFESIGFPTRLNAAFAPSRKPGAFVARFSRKLQRYMAIKALTSLATGLSIWVWLWFLGIDFAALLGLLAFLLNFIPFVGALLMTIPGVMLALVLTDLQTTLLVALGYLVANTLIIASNPDNLEISAMTCVSDFAEEIMVLTDRGGGIGRLVVDHFRRLLYSTDPKEVAALRRLRQGIAQRTKKDREEKTV